MIGSKDYATRGVETWCSCSKRGERGGRGAPREPRLPSGKKAIQHHLLKIGCNVISAAVSKHVGHCRYQDWWSTNQMQTRYTVVVKRHCFIAWLYTMGILLCTGFVAREQANRFFFLSFIQPSHVSSNAGNASAEAERRKNVE
jgi:hypothetical protein